MTAKDYLQFIRWKNVLILLLTLGLIKYALFNSMTLNVTLDDLHFGLLAISVVCIAVAGYIINDIYDVEADAINKPQQVFVGKKVSRDKAYNMYLACNSAGLISGMYLSYHVGHTSYFIIYLLTSLLLYQYAKDFKKRYVAGNLVISFVVLLSIALPLVFDVLPATNSYNRGSQVRMFEVVSVIAVYGFFLTLLREIVKDLEDVKGDTRIGARSFAIVLGEAKTRKLLLILGALVLTGVVVTAFLMRDHNLKVSLYLTIFVGVPLLYFLYYIYVAKDKKAYHRCSGLLKLIMLFGILTVLFI